MEPVAALHKYAADHCMLPKGDRMPPSERALDIYEKQTASAPLLPFPEDQLQHAAATINDSAITADVLREHFKRLRYTRLRVLEGRRKGVETRKKNQAAREEGAKLAALKSSKQAQRAAERKGKTGGAADEKMGSPAPSSSDDESERRVASPQVAKRGKKRQAVVVDDDAGDDVVVDGGDDANGSTSGMVDELDCEDRDRIENEKKACEKCGKKNRAATLLLCDSCDKAYHLHCLEPKLYAVPAGEWNCPVCCHVEEASDAGDSSDSDGAHGTPRHKLHRSSTYERNGWVASGKRKSRGPVDRLQLS
jgi:hypothetical protein